LPEPGYYTIAVNFGAVAGATNANEIRKALKMWIKEKAPGLTILSPDTAPFSSIREVPPGVPFEVILTRCHGGNGELYFKRISPNDIEDLRRVRLREALSRKCPKLENAKRKKENRKSMLILESNDIALANHFFIGEALIEGLKNREKNIPDAVYLVETDIPEHWNLWILKDGEIKFPSVPSGGPHQIDS
jgi:hypothetical protein